MLERGRAEDSAYGSPSPNIWYVIIIDMSMAFATDTNMYVCLFFQTFHHWVTYIK